MTCGKCYQPAALEMKWLRDSSSHACEIQVHQSSCGVVLLFASTTQPPEQVEINGAEQGTLDTSTPACPRAIIQTITSVILSAPALLRYLTPPQNLRMRHPEGQMWACRASQTSCGPFRRKARQWIPTGQESLWRTGQVQLHPMGRMSCQKQTSTNSL